LGKSDKNAHAKYSDITYWNLRGEVYNNNPRSIEALQNEITRVIGSIAVDELQTVSHNLCDARHVCKQKGITFSTCYKSR
jgi:hypothetical protein